MSEAEMPPELERLTLVLLRRPRDAPAYPEERLEEIHAQHLEHLAAMAEQGAMVAGGPFTDQADESLRGLCFYRTSLDETRTLAEQDPAVRAGRLAVDVLSWWFGRGTVRFERRAVE